MLNRLEVTDLLIDATHRIDPTRPIVPNPWIAALPSDAVILDLAVDPYDFTVDPPRTKGVEGVPHGNLDQLVFPVDDPAWDELDHRVDTRQRRLSLSCYAWPGVEPVDCMRVYGRQIEPVLRIALRGPVDRLDDNSPDQQERAVAHAELGRWLA
jgi:alanine dehydrogenase